VERGAAWYFRAMSNPPKPSLLQQLRTQSDALRAQDTAARQPFEAAVQAIDSNLWRAFRWLDEALGHLEVIRPKVAHMYPLDGILTVVQPQFERGFMAFRRGAFAGVDVLSYIEMFYRLAGPAPLILRVNPAAASGIEERLRAAPMQFQYQTEQDAAKVVRYGLFHVQPIVSASVRFQPDYARQVVDVTLRNVDRFESVVLEFPPDRLDEAALEDLVKFMLGEESGFLRRAPLALIKPRNDDKAVAPRTPNPVPRRRA
jgi:hypothetical protein